MVIVTPCINFAGQCEEAVALYERAFGAITKFVMRYSDADRRDWDRPLTDDQKKMVYHAEMFVGSQRIMLADIIEFDLSKGTSVFLTVTFEDAASVKRAYEVLKEGSTIVYPMVSTTYSSCFASLIDKFGVRWALMTEQTEK
jgi:PhnB protein